VQDVADATPECREPAILRPVRLALGEDHRMVLIEREEALAAPD
jgi:hypothetical protein